MALYRKIPISEIKIAEGRQRQTFEKIEELAESIQRVGLLQPGSVTSDLELIAGERRLRACIHLGWETFPVFIQSHLTPDQLGIAELEENLRRENLTWQEEVKAIAALHEAFALERNYDWTLALTAEALGIAEATVQRAIDLASEIAKGNPIIINAEKRSHAVTALKRAREAAKEEVMNRLTSPVQPQAPSSAPTTDDIVQSMIADDGGIYDGEVEPSTPELTSAPTFDLADFIEWSAKPSSVRYNVIHVDFPYGINMQKTGQVSSAMTRYDDSPDVFLKLLDTFVNNYFNFAHHVSHIIFWLDMGFYFEAVDALSSIPGALVIPHPLIWHKSDNSGGAPDHMRRPRKIYETALLVSVNDRKIRELRANLFSAGPDTTRAHMSAKPKDMLKHFLTMLVDDTTTFLDPTCGSGNAVFVAKELGAETALGLDIEPEHITAAQGRTA